MRAFAIVVILVAGAACGGGQNASNSTPSSPGLAAYPALRWAPDGAAYVVTAHSVRDGQRALTDFFDSLGMLARTDAGDVSRHAKMLLGFDPLGADAASSLGVDLDGGVLVFSEGFLPTIVVHLAAPATTHAFFDQLHKAGMTSTAAQVEGTEIDTTNLGHGLSISWAIDKDWLWFHVSAPEIDAEPDAAAWFVHAHHPTKATWRDGFAWASQLARDAKPLVGFWSSQPLIAHLVEHADGETANSMQCLRQLGAIKRVGFSIDGAADLHHASGRIALDIGPSASQIASELLPPPPGFEALASTAPLAVEWNLDLAAVSTWLAPCLSAMVGSPKELERTGVRAARGVLRSLEPDGKALSGALAFDLTSKAFFADQLETVPHRSLLESDQTYGAYKGHHLAIPFVVSVDYVLDDHIGLAAIGDGLLDQLVGGAAPSGPPPVFAIAIRPPALSEATWRWLFKQLDGERFADALTSRLVKWRDGRIALSIDHGALVLDASGNRR